MTEPTTDEPASMPEAPPRRSRALVIGLVVVFLLPLAAAAALLAVVASGDGGAEEVAFTVPADTNERIESGETVEILPARIDLEVGDTLIIENLDDEPYNVGPYIVGAGQTLRQTFNEPGLFEGVCQLHPSGGIEIVVGGEPAPEV